MNESTLLGYIGSSWVVARPTPDHGYDGKRVYFTGWYHDLNQRTLEERLGFTLTFATTTVLTILANLLNLIVLKRRQVRRDFLLLVALLALSNVLFCVFQTITLALVVPTGFWHWGTQSCAGLTWSIFVFGCYSPYSMMLISYERRLCLLSNDPTSRGNTKKILLLAAVLFIFVVLTFGTVAVYPFDVFSAQYVTAPGVNNGTAVPICAGFSYQLAQSQHFDTSLLIAIYFIVFVVLVPNNVLAMNYWMIFRSLRLARQQQQMAGSHGGTANSTNRSSAQKTRQNVAAISDWQEREMFFVKQSMVSFALFALSHVPNLFTFIFTIFYDSIGPYVLSSRFHLGGATVYMVEMVIGPLVQSVKPGFTKDVSRWWQGIKAKLFNSAITPVTQ